LLNSSGKVVATAESNHDLVAQINTQVNRTDTYFIKVSNADVEGNKGDYLISVIDPIINSNSDWTSSSSFALEQGTATDQWYKNTDALNIELLNEEFTGYGVTISVVDTGVDYSHTAFGDPSFTNNPGLNAWAKYENDFNLATYDENTGQYDVWNLADIAASQINSIYHGTRVSGIIAGSDTDFLGLSPGVEIQSLYRGATGETIRTANALNPNNYVTDGSVDWANPALVDISNNSWNYDTPFADNFLDSEGTTTRSLGDAIEVAAAGGVIFVFSAGNRGGEDDNVNYHNLTNSPLTIAVASVDQDNLSSTWSTPGSAILVAAYGDNIYTTDLSEYHNLVIPGEDPAYVADSGTSFAAPEVSAIIALMLEANPDLGYRDVQAILAHSAIKSNNVNEPGNYWQYNQGDNHNLVGMHFNDDMGFGIVNAHSAVRLAETWENVTNNGNVTSGEIFYGIGESDTENTISDTASLVKTLAVGDVEVEHVVLKVNLDHSYLSDVTIEITSPNGITSSTLMDTPDTDYSVNNFEFEFSSVQFYGEAGGGAWTVTISDSNNLTMIGELNSLELTVFGSSDDNNDQYIFTDEFVAIGVVAQDNSGEDWINTSAVTFDVVVDLSNSEVNFLDGQGVAAVTQDVSQLSSLDNIVTGDGDDLLIGTDVSNILDGGRGTDTVAYADLLDLDINYSVVFNPDHVLVTNLLTSATDILYSVEVLNFGGVLHPISTTGFITNLDTTIQADLTNYIDNVTLHYYENQLIDNVLTLIDTGVSTQVVDGSIAIGQSIDFDSVKLSISDVYTGGSMGMGIQADDAVEIERHAVQATESDSIIVPTIESAGGYQIAPNTSAWHAADINNDDAINVSDAVLLYRHIVDLDAIDTFDLIDGAGNRVTSLDANSTDAANWTIVANGDITQGGLWDADYTISMDIV
jgi:subtilisin-like proprotein convertase family protein/subtilisin family serine protease